MTKCSICKEDREFIHLHDVDAKNEDGYVWVCCKCLGHEFNSCWGSPPKRPVITIGNERGAEK